MFRLRFLLLIAVLLCKVPVQAQEPYKLWDKNAPLQWNDFAGPVNESSASYANGNTGTSYRFKFVMQGGKRVFTFDVVSRFYTAKSWSKPDKQAPEVLKYQQTYFNIVEFFTRLLKKDFEKAAYTANFQNEITQLYQQNVAQGRAMKSRFFAATAFADDEDVTDKWVAYVDLLLSGNYTLQEALQMEPVITLQSNNIRKLWEAKPLTWADFKGPIDATSAFSAATFSGIAFTTQVNESSGKYTLKFNTASYFKYNASWLRPEKQSEDLLRHEQMHYNISEFFARQLSKALNSYAFTSSCTDELSRIRKISNDQRKLMQEKYDEQTDHSKNKPMQKKWEEYIVQLLSKDVTVGSAFQNTPGGAVVY